MMNTRQKNLDNTVEIQIATKRKTPTKQEVTTWVDLTLSHLQQSNKSLTIRVIDSNEMFKLNKDFCGKDSSTNVISFPFAAHFMTDSDYLGDIAICAEVIMHEAHKQHKTYQAHFAHMVIHGILHLLGFNHITNIEVEKMENIEIALLAKLGFDNPYITTDTATSDINPS